MIFINVEGFCILKKAKNITIGKTKKENFDLKLILVKKINKQIKESTYECI